jgi:hypothetical protein
MLQKVWRGEKVGTDLADGASVAGPRAQGNATYQCQSLQS